MDGDQTTTEPRLTPIEEMQKRLDRLREWDLLVEIVDGQLVLREVQADRQEDEW